MKTQMEMFWESHNRLARRNEAFLDAVKDGMTRQELESLIKRRPNIWGAYSHWLDKLPEGN